MAFPGSQSHCGPCFVDDPLSPSSTSAESLVRTKSGNTVYGSSSGSPFQVDTIADLAALSLAFVPDGVAVVVLGCLEAGDGAGGTFLYSASSVLAGNGGTVVSPAVGPGRWLRSFSGVVNAKWFGVVGDGVADDTIPFAACVASLAATGGTVSIEGCQIKLTSSITLPVGVSVVGSLVYPDPRNPALLTADSDTLLLGTGVTIRMSETSALQGLKIVPFGMVFPQNAAQVATWAGTAVTILAGAHAASLSHLAIVGFARATDMGTSSFTEQTRMSYCAFDCVAGVKIVSGTDRVYLENVELWPTASIGLVSPTDADLQRSGISFELNASIAGIDAPLLFSCFSYAHATAFSLTSIDGAALINCVADYTVTKTVNVIGFAVQGDTSCVTFNACKVFRQSRGLQFSPNQPTHCLIVNSSSFEYCDNEGIYCSQGYGSIMGSLIRNLTNFTTYGVRVDNAPGTSRFFVDGCCFDFCVDACAMTGTSPGNTIVPGRNMVTGNGTNIFLGGTLGTYASAAALIIPAAEDTFLVSGTTGITSISSSFAWAGRRITLMFLASVTMTHSASLQLAGAVNFSATVNDNITLAWNGSAWVEIARTVI